ncbi:MAG: hypothetical protein ACSHYA_13180 [Opitutaceae bacterium]
MPRNIPKYLYFGFVASLPLNAQAYKATVRHTELENELALRNLALPTGSGVGVTQVESPQSGSDANDYLPDQGDDEFSGKTITDQTGGGTTSKIHGTKVGKNLYGTSTSMAPSIDSIDVYKSSDWLDNEGWETGTPATENNPLQNHSWISFSTSNSTTTRMDYAVVRDGFLPMAGIYNSDYGDQGIPKDIPETYGSMYNGITVGVSDGTHRTGLTSSADGPDRTKPEIVAPNDFTSYATPYVTAAAAMLIESAGTNTTAKQQLVLKATLLAAADKSPFPDWDQTTARPIDDIYGAGQLDVYENYFIQQAGQQAAGSSIDERGWNTDSLSANGSHNYTITVPAGFTLRNLSALATWNRTITRRGIGLFVSFRAGTLPNISLSLNQQPSGISQTSDSSVDNIEHIWRDESNELSEGDYLLTIASDRSTDYAIAWRSELYQDSSLWATTAFTTTPVADQDPTDDPDKDGIANLLEQAFGGDPELNDSSILPVTETIIDGDDSYLEISFRKPTYQNDLSYTVETITDLTGTWLNATSEVTLISIIDEAGDFDRYTYRRVAPLADNEQAFLRVSVTQ